jgi:putative glycosyltransferase (TIGR04348 family)
MKIIIVTPAKKGDRSGNRATANRWATILKKLGHSPHTLTEYDGAPCDAMMAIHAWRSAASIRKFRKINPELPLLLCLAGTDINTFQVSHPEETYGSMEIARRFHQKLHVIKQSAPPIRRKPSIKNCFEILVAGHLRDEKDPMRTAQAVRILPVTSRIQILHMGKAIDENYRRNALAEMEQNPRYNWVGEVPRWKVRQKMARAQAMIISSRQEGGANVVSEAIMADLPIIASKIDGNIGLLGTNYNGYYPAEDTQALTKLLIRIEIDAAFLKELSAQIRALKPKFTEKQELAAWKALLNNLSQV